MELGRVGPAKRRTVRIAPAGDEAVLVDFGNVIDREVNRRVRALASLLSDKPDWLHALLPAYSSLLVRYDPDLIRPAELHELLHRLAERKVAAEDERPRRVCVPVRYGGEDGPDLEFVAQATGLSPDEIVAKHARPTYVVYMLGFTPGFCYLGDLDPALAVERRATPRLSLPAGAVAIGGSQTGVYSLDNCPGGWRWIGRTPMPLWDERREPPFLLHAGDEVRFVPE